MSDPEVTIEDEVVNVTVSPEVVAVTVEQEVITVVVGEGGGSGEPHTLLSTTHTDTLFPLVNPLTPGDMLYVNPDSKWTNGGIGTEGQILKVVSGFPSWQNPTDTLWVDDGDFIHPFNNSRLTIGDSGDLTRPTVYVEFSGNDGGGAIGGPSCGRVGIYSHVTRTVGGTYPFTPNVFFLESQDLLNYQNVNTAIYSFVNAASGGGSASTSFALWCMTVGPSGGTGRVFGQEINVEERRGVQDHISVGAGLIDENASVGLCLVPEQGFNTLTDSQGYDGVTVGYDATCAVFIGHSSTSSPGAYPKWRTGICIGVDAIRPTDDSPYVNEAIYLGGGSSASYDYIGLYFDNYYRTGLYMYNATFENNNAVVLANAHRVSWGVGAGITYLHKSGANLYYHDGSTDWLLNTSGVTAHNLLSATHGDTVSASPVSGDILYANATPKWTKLAKGTDGQVLTLASGLPSWATPSAGSSLWADNGTYISPLNTTHVKIYDTGDVLFVDDIRIGDDSHYLFKYGERVIWNDGSNDYALAYNNPIYSLKTATSLKVPQGGQTMVGFFAMFKDPDGDFHLYGSKDTSSERSAGIHYNKLTEERDWVYDTNVEIVTSIPGLSSLAVCTVLYHPSGLWFYGSYKYIMLYIDQPIDYAAWKIANPLAVGRIVEHPTSVGWGMLMMRFSNNPNTGWSSPWQFSLDGTHVVLAEHASMFYTGTTLLITVCEGDTAAMLSGLNAYTYAYCITSDSNEPQRGTRVSTGYFNTTGISGYNPSKTLTSPNTTDNNPICFNLSTSFDATLGHYFLTRAYAYPFDVGSTGLDGEVPANGYRTKGLPSLPNRCQLYRKSVGTTPVWTGLYSGTWELLGDYGYYNGYYIDEGAVGEPRPCECQEYQTNVQGDVTTMCILTDSKGLADSSNFHMIMALDTMATRTITGENGGYHSPHIFRLV